MQIKTATTIAAAASAQGKPAATPASPISTATDDHMSEEKCSASASQRFARRRLGDAIERARAEKIDRDRAADDAEGRGVGVDRMRLRADQPLRGLEDHHG